MRKIKHIKDLKEEKMRLRIRQLELEKEICSSWLDLKESLKPSTLFASKFSTITHKKIKEKGLFSTTLSNGAAYLTRQFVNATGEKIEAKVQETIENVADRLKNIFEKNNNNSNNH